MSKIRRKSYKKLIISCYFWLDCKEIKIKLLTYYQLTPLSIKSILTNLMQKDSFLLSRKSLILMIALLSTLHSFGQYKGKVRVFTRPDDAIIKIDSINLKYGEFIELDTGKYTIKSWTTKRELITKPLQLDSAELITVRVDLPYSHRYKNYRYKTIVYKVSKNFLRFAPFVACSFIAMKSYKDMQTFTDDSKRFKEQSLDHQSSYENSFWESNQNYHLAKFEENLNNYNDANDNLNKAQSIFIISSASAVVFTYVGWKLSNKLKKPTYEEKRLLSDLSISPILSPQYSGLSINCKIK